MIDWSALLAPVVAGIFAVLVALIGIARERAKTTLDVSIAKDTLRREVNHTERALLQRVVDLEARQNYTFEMWKICEERAAKMTERIAVLENNGNGH